MSYNDGIEHPSKNNNHSRRNGVNTKMNEIDRMKKQKPFILMDEEYPCKISLRFKVCEGFDRVLTTFADEKRTKERLKKDVFFGDDGRYHIKEGTALYKLASILLENHLDSHDDEGNYVNDMETKINIRKSLAWGIKADEFYLDDSITFIDSHLPPFLVWSVINEQGQQIVFLEHKKHPLQWSLDGNILDDNGNSDYFSEKYDGESLYYDPINTIYPTNL
jgi:hypothetical protein